MLSALQASHRARPDSLNDKARGKCLICRQAGHWAKECPNRDKSPRIACHKYHQLGHWAALCPWDPRASRSSAKTCLTMVQEDRSGPIQPARLSQITITGLESRAKLDVAGRSENFLVDTGATYSVLISYSGAFSSQTCTVLGATGKATTKRFTQALLGCWDGQIFSHQFLVVLECPTPLLGRDILTKLGTTLLMGSFSDPRALQLLVTTEEPITPSPIERDQNLWEDQINPHVWDQGIPG